MRTRSYLFERAGVLLHVEYVPATRSEPLLFKSIRVADINYKPVGPNLMLLMHDLVLIEQREPDIVGATVLQLIADEIEETK